MASCQSPAKGNPRLGTRQGPQRVSALTKIPLPTDRQGVNPLCSDLPLSLGGANIQTKAGVLAYRPRVRGRITVAGQRRIPTGFAISPSRGTFVSDYSIVMPC